MPPYITSTKIKVTLIFKLWHTYFSSDLLSSLTSEAGNAADLKSASAAAKASFVSLTQERENLN